MGNSKNWSKFVPRFVNDSLLAIPLKSLLNQAQERMSAGSGSQRVGSQRVRPLVSSELERQSPVAKQLEHTKEFKETDIVKRIFDLLDHPTISLSDDELDSLTKTVSLFYPPLIHDLTQAKDISVLGRRVCMLAILNLRPGDIANLLNLSSQQVSNLRLNLNHSLFGEESARTLYKNLVQRYGIYTS